MNLLQRVGSAISSLKTSSTFLSHIPRQLSSLVFTLTAFACAFIAAMEKPFNIVGGFGYEFSDHNLDIGIDALFITGSAQLLATIFSLLRISGRSQFCHLPVALQTEPHEGNKSPKANPFRLEQLSIVKDALPRKKEAKPPVKP